MKFFLTILFALLWIAPASAGVIEGRVVLGDDPVVGVEVHAYPTLDFSLEPVAVSALTDAEGMYRIELPAGRYALFAEDSVRKIFAFCGRNPVGVADEIWR